jgi:Rrf2 family cysteine metabolism transcriptional repressor
MKLTSRGELALKAVLELSKVEHTAAPGLSAAEIARRCNASVKFLEQVLAQLKAGGYVVSRLGARGGYRLTRGPEEIFVGEVSRLIDGPLAPAPCASLTQHRTCDWCEDEASCTLKSVWIEVRDAVANVMDGVSFGELVRRAEAEGGRPARYYI